MHFLALRIRQALAVLLVVLIAFVGGCGGPKAVPVSGQVTVNGVPLAKGTLSFNPEPADPKKPVPAGTIEGGSYTIYTNGKPGAELGKYKVVIAPTFEIDSTRPTPPKSPFDPSFSDLQKTTLKVEVVENPSPGAYDFKLK